MDRSQFNQAAFKSNKSVEANGFRLCYEIRAYVFDSDSRKLQKSLIKYKERVLQILKGEHRLSRLDDHIYGISSAFRQNSILEFFLTNITVFSLNFCRDLFNIFLLCLDQNLEEHIVDNISSISTLLITPVSSLDLDLLSGQFLRDLMQNRNIFKELLTINTYDSLIQVACSEIFEISSDACESIRLLLNSNESVDFINTNHLNILQGLYILCDKGYYSKRVALKLLYELIKDENNATFAENYIKNEENLKYAMNLMKLDEAVEVKIEAFYLFSQQVRLVLNAKNRFDLLAYKIILRNRDKILRYLEKFKISN